ncbi:DUF559 domain-containing protein [Synechococcus sp. PCC 6312]|uniref:DUF559 domain-containing protein n=1 Tax=Synechococcus sp. (strain ATCC 27167 / PCC 6312) TaxID=195253 RepID=UPI00029EC3EA|nr:DUF559 domain-containing protein [Synechococcus sp. PCC 6312]AFY62800.1 hypothetical protein Syn6312_3790 [Synechococcus sp. PCC 6312]
MESYICQTGQMLKLLGRHFGFDGAMKLTADFLKANAKNPGGWKIRGFVIAFCDERNQKRNPGEQLWYKISIAPECSDDDKQKCRIILKQNVDALEGKSGIQRVPGGGGNQETSQQTHYKYEGLDLRSPAELAIAQELDKYGVSYFANARGHFVGSTGQIQTREVDFLVICQGQMRILEVDGSEFHQNAAKDYARDRLLDLNGLRTTRFTANECINSPSMVVTEFLSLFGGFVQRPLTKEDGAIIDAIAF